MKRQRETDISLFCSNATPHRFARQGDQWVCAWQADEGGEYTCDCANGPHRMKLVRPSGRTDRRSFASYFAHVATSGHYEGSGSGESMLHRNAKYMLRMWLEDASAPRQLEFATEHCPRCDQATPMRTFAAAEYRIELERRSIDGRWRYDCVLFARADGARIAALEVVATHACSRAKLAADHGDGMVLAEFRALGVDLNIQHALRTEGESTPTTVSLDNLLLRRRTCAACHYAESVRAITSAWERERAAWEDLDILQTQEWARLDAERMAREAREREALERQRRLEGTIMDFLDALAVTPTPSAAAHAALVIQHFGSAMRLVVTQYTPERTLRGWDRTALPDGAQCFRLGNFALLLIDDSWTTSACARVHAAKRHLWQRHDVPRQNVAALNVAHVVRSVPLIQAAYLADQHMTFKSCLYPILKQCEDEYQICAHCGVSGHRSEACGARQCTRCGEMGHAAADCAVRVCRRCKRRGHLAGDCFAKRALDGTPLRG